MSILILLAGNFVWSSSAKVTAALPVRVMIIGDSITVGEDGDYTWRYRLMRHFAQVNARIDLVGDFTKPMAGCHSRATVPARVVPCDSYVVDA